MKKIFYPSLLSYQFFTSGNYFIIGIGIAFIWVAWDLQINLFITIDALIIGMTFIYFGLSQYRKSIKVTDTEIIIDKSVFGSVCLPTREIFSLGIGSLTIGGSWFPYYSMEYALRHNENLYSVSLRVWTKDDIIKAMEYIKITHPEITIIQYEHL